MDGESWHTKAELKRMNRRRKNERLIFSQRSWWQRFLKWLGFR